MTSERPGRASKACNTCRKRKQRCFDSSSSKGSCLRCKTLKQQCSLEHSPPARSRRSQGVFVQASAGVESTTDERLDRLESTVNLLVDRLGPHSEQSGSRATSSFQEGDTIAVEAAQAPILLIRDVASEVGVKSPYGQGLLSAQQQEHDIITIGLLSTHEAIDLLALFNEHYGRWVAFDEAVSPETLLSNLKHSSLLLCACCLIAVRHTTQELAVRLAPRLFQEAKSLVSNALLTTPQPIQFFQAAVILSMWSNNDCYCVGTRRKALLKQSQIERCRKILDSDYATNHDSRMVAEVCLYWVIYERCSSGRIDLPAMQTALHTWKNEWQSLFDQARSQFLQMGYHFAQLLAFGQALKLGTTAMRESLLSEMVRLSATILNLAMETTDERTRHLTDHIYHIIMFASVTLCRLLHKYQDQLRRTHDVADLDALVVRLASWLRSIGLPCHIAHTLGDVVSALHKKLRPHAEPLASAESEINFPIDSDIGFMFPELFGAEIYDVNNSDWWQGLEPLITDGAESTYQ